MITIQGDEITVIDRDGKATTHRLGSPEGFGIISRLWLRSGWDAKYVYGFSWLGRPIIQLPEDMVRIQELIFRTKPDVIIETGVAHGGSLIFSAGLCKAMDHGRVIGVDIEIRPHNRKAIEEHFLFPYITLVEGSSIEEETVSTVRRQIKAGESVLVILDACHTKDHVTEELRAYGPLVSKDSYIVAADGIMEEVVGAPRTQDDWSWNNPRQAALAFVQENPDFAIEQPPFPFNEGEITEPVTYWPDGFLRRLREPKTPDR